MYVYILVSVVSTAACLLVAAAVVVCLSTARRRGRAEHLRAVDRSAARAEQKCGKNMGALLRCKKHGLRMHFKHLF